MTQFSNVTFAVSVWLAFAGKEASQDNSET